MMKKLLIFGLIIVILISGCTQGSVGVNDLLQKGIDSFVGKSVTVNGQLGFNCPTVIGASYPQDCIAEICDSSGAACMNLHVDNNPKIKETLNGYYNVSSGKKVNISVTGVLEKNSCPSNDNACSATYFIQVSDIRIIP